MKKTVTNSPIAIRKTMDYFNQVGTRRVDEDYANLHTIINRQNAEEIDHIRSGESVKGNHMTATKRYHSVTKKLYEEKLRFKDGQRLMNFDIEIEDAASARKVRRIVEKRMCQAYHQKNKHQNREDGQNRYYMKDAVVFQIHNLGHKDYDCGNPRSESTHWKKIIDPITGNKVLRAKRSYSSLQKAEEAALIDNLKHPKQVIPMSAYKCKYCNKWHIGHRDPRNHTSMPHMKISLEMDSKQSA